MRLASYVFQDPESYKEKLLVAAGSGSAFRHRDGGFDVRASCCWMPKARR